MSLSDIIDSYNRGQHTGGNLLHYEVGTEELKSCNVCGRTFIPKSLERHVKICEKSKKLNNRTVFNSFFQRAKEIGATPVKAEEKKSRSKSKRKDDPENLIGGSKTSPEGLTNGLSPHRAVPPGYRQCCSCERYFNDKAADRHIAWCQEQKCRLPKTPPDAQAMQRLQARIKYRAPLLKKKSPRLVKSADSIRESSTNSMRSSLPDVTTHLTNQQMVSNNKQNELNNYSCTSPPKDTQPDLIKKKIVKFKDIFPGNNRERNKNLDMLAALRLRLDELSTHDDLFNDYILKCERLPSSVGKEGVRLPRFCYNCGTKYPVVSAKYCCECGAHRFAFDNALPSS